MENIDAIFAAALSEKTASWGSKRKLSIATGLSEQYIGKIARGVKRGSESTRRKIADALGFPQKKYEEFLDIGRVVLAGSDGSSESEIQEETPTENNYGNDTEYVAEPPSEEDLFLTRPPELRYFYYALNQLLPGRDRPARVKLAYKVRIQTAVIDRVLNRRDLLPETEIQEKIAAAFDMSLDGFLFVGRRIDEEVSTEILNAFPETVIDLPDEEAEAERSGFYDLILDQAPAPSPEPNLRPVPMLGLAHCGRKGWNAVMPISVSAAPISLGPRAFAVTVDGLSMLPEGLGPGMICYCDPDQAPLPGDAVYVGLQQVSGGSLGSIKKYLGIGPQVELPTDWIKVRGWDDPDKHQHQNSFVINIPPRQVELLATVIYVRRRV